MSEHCSVVMPGVRGDARRELYITGGRGRGDRVMKLSLDSGRWYSLTRLSQPRRQHACTKVVVLPLTFKVESLSSGYSEWETRTRGEWRSVSRPEHDISGVL